MGKIRFTGFCAPISKETLDRHTEYARSLGLPLIKEAPASGKRLAVIGGGPSIKSHVDEMKNWDGDIWAVNAAWIWAKSHGIDTTFFSICAGVGWDAVFPEPVEPGSKAIIGEWCEPYLFDVFAKASVQLVSSGRLKTGSTSATAAWMLGPMMGYSGVTFFGCESSYEDMASHAYSFYDHKIKDNLLIRVSGVNYRTTPQLLVQAEYMSEVLREFPFVFSEKSGGLLRALIENPDYDLIAASPRIMESLQ